MTFQTTIDDKLASEAEILAKTAKVRGWREDRRHLDVLLEYAERCNLTEQSLAIVAPDKFHEVVELVLVAGLENPSEDVNLVPLLLDLQEVVMDKLREIHSAEWGVEFSDNVRDKEENRGWFL